MPPILVDDGLYSELQDSEIRDHSDEEHYGRLIRCEYYYKILFFVCTVNQDFFSLLCVHIIDLYIMP